MSEHPEYIRGVKDCIATCRGAYITGLMSPDWGAGASAAANKLVSRLEALLPKDHAKAAVEAFREWRDRAVADGAKVIVDADEAFARWLEQQGVDLSRWGE